MRPRRARAVNRFLAAVAFGALLAAGSMATARADGYLDDAEIAYVLAYGPTAICPTIASYPSVPGVLGVASAIMDEGWRGDDVADIINAAVAEYCPRFWPLLVAIGNAARGESAALVAIGNAARGESAAGYIV